MRDSFQIPIYAWLLARTINADSSTQIDGRYLLLRSPSTPVVSHAIDSVVFEELQTRVVGLVDLAKRRTSASGSCGPARLRDVRLQQAVSNLWWLSQQQRSTRKNTVVWASAGTGKTHKLVEVYLELLQEGIDPLRIVAVTFTERAAAEMRQRIRSAIYSRLAETPESERGRWMRVLAVLPAAPISTLHGFGGLILRERGMALGIDPEFSILNEQQSLDLAREAVVETLRSEIRGGNEGIAKLFGDFGLERLVETVVDAGYWLNSLGKDAAWLEQRIHDQELAAGGVLSRVEEYINRYGSDFEAIGTLADDLDAKKAKHPFKKRDDPDFPLPRIGQIAGVETARQLCDLVAATSARFKARKRALNALDFDDLLLGARDLLARFADVQRFYHEQFEAVLVDEFQDTDEVQAEILQLLAPRRLMVVGRPEAVDLSIPARASHGFLSHAPVDPEQWRSARTSSGEPPLVRSHRRVCESSFRIDDGRGREETIVGRC